MFDLNCQTFSASLNYYYTSIRMAFLRISSAWEYPNPVNFHLAFDIQFIFLLICVINIREKNSAHKSLTGSLPHNLCALWIFIICYFNDVWTVWSLNLNWTFLATRCFFFCVCCATQVPSSLWCCGSSRQTGCWTARNMRLVFWVEIWWGSEFKDARRN